MSSSTKGTRGVLVETRPPHCATNDHLALLREGSKPTAQGPFQMAHIAQSVVREVRLYGDVRPHFTHIIVGPSMCAIPVHKDANE